MILWEVQPFGLSKAEAEIVEESGVLTTGEQGVSGMSPVSLSSMMQSVENSNESETEGNGLRNHDLDFQLQMTNFN